MKKVCFFILIIASCTISFAQKDESIYNNQWKEIDSLIVEKGLPKTALEKVNTLYADAKQKNIHDEIIRALLYRMSLEEKTEDNDINKQTALLKEQLQTTNDIVSKSILQ